MDMTPEKMKARFAELTEARAGLDAKLAPLREELASIVQGTADLHLTAARARETDIRAQIVKLQDALFPVEQERGALARALKWQVS